MPKTVSDAARRISHALVRSIARPKAMPEMAAMTGCVHLDKEVMAAWKSCFPSVLLDKRCTAVYEDVRSKSERSASSVDVISHRRRC